ncbi:MAG: ribosome maturation factor RimM [Myxococcota bacterium]
MERFTQTIRPSPGWVPIATVLRPFGIKGALRCKLFNLASQSLRAGVRVSLRLADKQREFCVQRVQHGCRIHLSELASRTEAEAWRGAGIWIRREDLPKLARDELYLVDVLDQFAYLPDGRLLGRVVAFADNGAQRVVCIKTEGQRTVEIPFVKPIVHEVRPDGGIVLNPPAGLFEICGGLSRYTNPRK